MNTSKRYPPELRGRAVRLVLEHEAQHASQWAALESIALKVGCTTETLRRWVRQAERDQSRRAGQRCYRKPIDARLQRREIESDPEVSPRIGVVRR